MFQPLADGKATGPYVVFADGFAGAHKEPGRAAFRPTGLAEAPDGSLFIADDMHGRIWRVTYRGDGSGKIAAAPAPAGSETASASAMPPEGMHPDAGRTTPALPPPPGATVDQVALGNRIFHGEASNGTCSGCHGTDAGGSSVGPALNTGHWLWGDGSLASITSTIEKSVEHPSSIKASFRRWVAAHSRNKTWRLWPPTSGLSVTRRADTATGGTQPQTRLAWHRRYTAVDVGGGPRTILLDRHDDHCIMMRTGDRPRNP